MNFMRQEKIDRAIPQFGMKTKGCGLLHDNCSRVRLADEKETSEERSERLRAEQPELYAYIELCRRIYDRMEREGFPWDTESNDPTKIP